MDARRRWLNYDTFKLIVALILLIIFVILMLRPVSPTPVQEESTAAPVAAVPTATLEPTLSPTSPAPLAAATATTVAETTAATATTVATATTAATATTVATATTAAVEEATPTPTSLPAAETEATATPTIGPTATPEPAQPGTVDCPQSLPPRLVVGKQARVITNLHLRADAGLENKVLHINLPKTTLQVIGGPVCKPYGGGAYLWWNVQQADGTKGWSAEGSLPAKFYFLEPIP